MELPKRTSWVAAACWMAVWLAAPAVGIAQEGDESAESDSASDPEGETTRSDVDDSESIQVESEGQQQDREQVEKKRVNETDRKKEIRRAMRRQLQTAQKGLPIYQLAEEMIDEVVTDVRELRKGPISPAAVRKMGLTPNLSGAFGQFVEGTLVSALSEHTDVIVKRCTACESMRSRIEDGKWVVTQGMTEQKQVQREAERLGVKTFLDTRFSYFPEANVCAMELEFVRAEDGAVLWSETYRSDATTAAILRTGDRVKSRAERVQELERKIEEQPYYGHMAYLGATVIPYDDAGGPITGGAVGYRLFEEFGNKRQWRYAIVGEGFLNFQSPLLGGFVGLNLQHHVFEPNLNKIAVWTGPSIMGFFAGQPGGSVSFQWGIDAELQFRLGAGASLMYFVPMTFAGNDLGGFGAKLRATFNW